MIPSSLAAFFGTVGFTVGSSSPSQAPTLPELISKSCSLSHDTLIQYIEEAAIDNTLSVKEGIAEKKFAVGCNKGNKCSIGHFVKVISWWSPNKNSIDMFTVDIDASKGLSKDCAAAINYSLKQN